jgi:hypothetical protein
MAGILRDVGLAASCLFIVLVRLGVFLQVAEDSV